MDEQNKSQIRNALDRKNIQYGYDTEKLKQENRYRVSGAAFPQKDKQFNWGACILGPIWGLFNNTPIACLGFVLPFIPFIGIILSLGFSIYCGIKGNEWALNNKKWKDRAHFHEVQKNWAAAGVFIELFMIIFSVKYALDTVNKVLESL